MLIHVLELIEKSNTYSDYKTEVTKEKIVSWANDKFGIQLNDEEKEFLFEYIKDDCKLRCVGEEGYNRENRKQQIQFYIETDRIQEKMNQLLSKYLKEECSKLSENEISDIVLELANKWIVNSEFLKYVKIESLLDRIKEIKNEKERENLLYKIKASKLSQYINDNGVNKNELLNILKNMGGIEVSEVIFRLQNDTDKTILLLLTLDLNKEEKRKMLSEVSTEYFRVQLVKQISDESFDTSELKDNIEKYNKAKKQLDSLKTEREKAEFISNLEDYDMRIDFLKQIKSIENRNLIINSFKRKIDPEIESEVNFVNNMIIEFFEDTLAEHFTDDKRERLNIIFNRADVICKDLQKHVYANADSVYNKIRIDYKKRTRKIDILSDLIHEYGHLFSRFDFKSMMTPLSYEIEEGTQDLFSELVINHYFEKHRKIELDGEVLVTEYPYVSNSGYYYQNGWPRTLLYPLQKDGKDIQALSEYLLGDKNKYLELVIGKEQADRVERDGFGNPRISEIEDWEELYHLHENEYSDIDRNSIYYRRNFILPIYEIQNRTKKCGINILNGDVCELDDVVKMYWGTNNLDEVAIEEIQDLYNLVIKQIINGDGMVITDSKGTTLKEMEDLVNKRNDANRPYDAEDIISSAMNAELNLEEVENASKALSETQKTIVENGPEDISH